MDETSKEGNRPREAVLLNTIMMMLTDRCMSQGNVENRNIIRSPIQRTASSIKRCYDSQNRDKLTFCTIPPWHFSRIRIFREIHATPDESSLND
ncbi:hypothetical protein TNCV_2592551 [Trichonephila clavipes]|nr:hypothetical protein TNCV_2592551 [Trichonephila clavipes]